MLIFVIVCILILTSCSSSVVDSDYFYGEIHRVEVPKTEYLQMSENHGDGIYHSPFVVSDSLIVYWLNGGSHNFRVCDLRTGANLGDFVSRGRAENEVTSSQFLYQIYEDCNGDKITAVYGFNENRLLLWNISRSVKEGRTVIDRTYRFGVDDNVRYYTDYYILHDTCVVAYMPSVYTTLSNDKISQPEVRYLSLPDRRTLREYSLFPKIIETESEDPRVDNLLFFRTCNAMKPDGSKYAMAMGFLPQINILDLASGKIGYYRLKGGAGVGSLLGKPNIKTYHSQPVCDDNYIYSLYYGFVDDRYAAADLEEKVSNFPHLVHVYDWDGNLVKVFDLGQRVNSISVSDGVLWAVNYYTEELWSCDISDKL